MILEAGSHKESVSFCVLYLVLFFSTSLTKTGVFNQFMMHRKINFINLERYCISKVYEHKKFLLAINAY